MRSNTNLFLEYLWLIIAAGAVVAGIHQWYFGHIGEDWLLWVMALIAFAMYGFRRRLRLNQKSKEE
ncbi:MAG: hypothetical protein JXR60_07620 [Bacteroidales bacterium]|nr:hypothetical protein [Bacteroidales bacterium]